LPPRHQKEEKPPFPRPFLKASNEMRKPRKSNRRSSRPRNSVNPSPRAITYTGPTRLPAALQQNDTMTTQLNNSGQLTSSGAGVIATVFGAYLQMSTSADFANFQSLYSEYRILSMEVEFIPWNSFNTPTTTTQAPLYTVTDRQTATALASVAQAINYDSLLAVVPQKRFKRSIKMDSTDEANWIAIGSSPATGSNFYVKLYSSGNANSTIFYDFIARVLVQFRGRQ
jgi:hypothetical protein